MSTGLPGSRGRLRRAIDDETNALELSIRASIRALKNLKSRHNALAPISSLPLEILVAIFSFLSPSTNTGACHLGWIYVSHVCRRWRETAVSHPRLWSYINFSKLAPAAVDEMISRAKMVPLHLEADFTKSSTQIDPFQRLLEAHISHTRLLKISGSLLPVFQLLLRAVSSAPALEVLSLTHKSDSSDLITIPTNLFNRTAPNLTSLRIKRCNISWKSPLLRGLRTLKIIGPSGEARPELGNWLDALDEMPQLQTLVLVYATPHISSTDPPTSEPSRTVTLPSLTKFRIVASAKDCVLALAHLVLPALTGLQVDAGSHKRDGEDVRLLIPYVSRNVCEMQDTEPLRSILIDDKIEGANVVAWTIPDVDSKFIDPNAMVRESVPACFIFTSTGRKWPPGVDTEILEALLTHLPLNSVSTLTTRNSPDIRTEFWVNQAPKWPLLERASLTFGAALRFMLMLIEDAPPDGPRLPSLTKLDLIGSKVTETATMVRNVLMERAKQGVPLEIFDASKS